MIWDQIFYLVNYCNISYSEAWDMPIEMRHWWFDRLLTERKREAEQIEKNRK